jgi:plasmid stabilization system protein ParE
MARVEVTEGALADLERLFESIADTTPDAHARSSSASVRRCNCWRIIH